MKIPLAYRSPGVHCKEGKVLTAATAKYRVPYAEGAICMRASRLEDCKARSATTNNVLQKRDIRSLSTIFLRNLHNMYTNDKLHRPLSTHTYHNPHFPKERM